MTNDITSLLLLSIAAFAIYVLGCTDITDWNVEHREKTKCAAYGHEQLKEIERIELKLARSCPEQFTATSWYFSDCIINNKIGKVYTVQVLCPNK